MNTKLMSSLLILSASAFAIPALAADDAFVQNAAMGGLAEVEAGGLAQQRGSSDAVKQFGTQMVTDHTKANDELKTIASSKSIQVPDAPDAKHQAAKTALAAKSGRSFDQAFKAQMVADHKATIALFERESKSGSDPDLKAFATKTLPDLRGHLKMAMALK